MKNKEFRPGPNEEVGAGGPLQYPMNSSSISDELNFAPETLIGEVRIRSVRILIDLGLTWFTRDLVPGKVNLSMS